jgi:hypothetical protein
VTCPRTFIQRRLESRGFVRLAARVEQRAIGGAGRGCAADRPCGECGGVGRRREVFQRRVRVLNRLLAPERHRIEKAQRARSLG